MWSDFNIFKNMGIANRLSWSIGTITIIALALLSTSVGYQTYQLAVRNTQEIIRQASYHYAFGVKTELESALDEARALAKVLEAAVQHSPPIFNRDQANQIFQHFIETHPNFLATWVMFEPNAFDGKDADFVNTKGHDQTGRFLPYWRKSENKETVLEPLTHYKKENIEDFYLVFKKNPQETILEPVLHIIEEKNIFITSAVVPMFNKEQQFIGIVGIDLIFERIVDFLKQRKLLFDTEYVTLYSNTGKLLATSHEKNQADLGKHVRELSPSAAYVEKVLSGKEFTIERYSRTLEKMLLTAGIPLSVGNVSNQWLVTLSIPVDELHQPINNLLIKMAIFGIVLAGLLFGIIYSLATTIAKNIQQAVNIADNIAEGNLSVDIPVTKYDETGLLMGALKNMSINLAQIVNDVQRSVAAATSGSQALSATSQQLMRGATHQSEAAEEISASMEQMSASIKQTSENARHTERIATQAATDATQTGQAVDKAIFASQQIIQKLSVIEDIAKQINILSLNASIEAARAGPHGKGFKVVAASIRELAGLSHRAAADINALSSNSMQTTQIAKTMLDQLVSDIQRTADLMRDISAASHEQSINAEQVNQSITELHKITQQNASASEELATMAEQLSTQAQQLAYTITYLKI